MMIQMSFGKACKYYREIQSLSQEKFALLIGMDRTYYASVEAGKRNISIQNMQKISDGFGIPISQLLTKTEEILKGDKNGK